MGATAAMGSSSDVLEEDEDSDEVELLEEEEAPGAFLTGAGAAFFGATGAAILGAIGAAAFLGAANLGACWAGSSSDVLEEDEDSDEVELLEEEEAPGAFFGPAAAGIGFMDAGA